MPKCLCCRTLVRRKRMFWEQEQTKVCLPQSKPKTSHSLDLVSFQRLPASELYDFGLPGKSQRQVTVWTSCPFGGCLPLSSMILGYLEKAKDKSQSGPHVLSVAACLWALWFWATWKKPKTSHSLDLMCFQWLPASELYDFGLPFVFWHWSWQVALEVGVSTWQLLSQGLYDDLVCLRSSALPSIQTLLRPTWFGLCWRRPGVASWQSLLGRWHVVKLFFDDWEDWCHTRLTDLALLHPPPLLLRHNANAEFCSHSGTGLNRNHWVDWAKAFTSKQPQDLVSFSLQSVPEWSCWTHMC